MPELPEVETVRRGLSPHLVGRRLECVDVREPRLRYPVVLADLERHVTGRRVRAVDRRAKYLLVRLEGNGCLLVHLGMTGHLGVVSRYDEVPAHTHVVFGLVGGLELRYRDPRRFGVVAGLAADTSPVHPLLAHLGIEPLSDEFTGERLHRQSRGARKPIKNHLMDARVVVGIGNIYASEALHAARIHPGRAAGRVGRERWDRLCTELQRILRAAIDQGGTTLNDFRDVGGAAGAYATSLAVYGRQGEPCPRCSAPIRRRALAGRSTFYCARCQR